MGFVPSVPEFPRIPDALKMGYVPSVPDFPFVDLGGDYSDYGYSHCADDRAHCIATARFDGANCSASFGALRGPSKCSTKSWKSHHTHRSRRHLLLVLSRRILRLLTPYSSRCAKVPAALGIGDSAHKLPCVASRAEQQE